ncbi:MAG TPA: chromosomal replication initiator protein DnaA [Terriglobales bacterium]|nr:chromosomal replication initiator protein DnaA [Terriglobales bacterium]
MERAWHQAVELLRTQVEADEYERYVRTLRPLAIRQRSFLMEAASRKALDIVNQRHLRLIEDTLSRIVGMPVRVVLQPPAGVQQELFPLPAEQPKAEVPEGRRESGLNPRLTFESFVVGGSNQFAHAACKAVANLPGDHYNPLYIYGAKGSGKSHLVNAVGNQILASRPDCRILYLTAESFMNELIAAIRRERGDQFKNRFRRVEVLILDDVQLLAGRERTQEEFFHTFNTLYEARRQIVLAADRFPKDIANLEERLRNRFEWGLIADLQTPEVETRVAILQRKAEEEHLALPADVALLVATEIDSNVRDLETALTRLGAVSSLERVDISVDLARQVLKDIGRQRDSQLTIEAIQKAVCEFFRIRAADLRSKKRTRTIALPRQVAMYLCRRHTNASFPTIGDRFGGRDHSTVIHAANVITERMKEDPSLKATVERIEQLLAIRG